MSPKLKRPRKIVGPPPVKGFKPYGTHSDLADLEPITLHLEEYEALRLCDYDMLTHHQAAIIMGVSRPTFTRIYASVRQKIALAFAEGRSITIEGGKVYMDTGWHHCKSCACFFSHPDLHSQPTECPLCGSLQIEGVANEDIDDQNLQIKSDLCVCPGCGYTAIHQPGIPCKHQICPKCNAKMRRSQPK